MDVLFKLILLSIGMSFVPLVVLFLSFGVLFAVQTTEGATSIIEPLLIGILLIVFFLLGRFVKVPPGVPINKIFITSLTPLFTIFTLFFFQGFDTEMLSETWLGSLGFILSYQLGLILNYRKLTRSAISILQ